MEHVYQDALSRKPTPEESQLALEALSQLTADWENRQTGSKVKPAEGKESPSPETRALANFCHVIMNSAEFLFVD